MADTPNLIAATSNLPKGLYSGWMPSSLSEIYAGPANKSTVIMSATLCNESGSTRTVRLSYIVAGGTVGASNRVAVIPLVDGESCVVEELIGVALGPGDAIWGLCSAGTAVSFTITGAVSS